MLVLLSDVHFTDGTSGTTIHPRAFEKFGKILLDIIGDNPCPNQIEEMRVYRLARFDLFNFLLKK